MNQRLKTALTCGALAAIATILQGDFAKSFRNVLAIMAVLNLLIYGVAKYNNRRRKNTEQF